MKHKPVFKNLKQERWHYQRRVVAAGIMMVLLLLVLLSRLCYLQVLEHTRYTTLSNQNQVELTPIAPNRGLIFDRNGVLLARNTAIFNLELIPARVPDLKVTLSKVKKLLPISALEMKRFKKQLKQHRHFEYVTLKTKLNEKEVAIFSTHRYDFPGVRVKAHLIRDYPQGNILSHVLGYVGRINEKELSKVDPTNYSATNYIGKTGVEHFYEAELHGEVGYQQAEVNAAGRTIRILNRQPPIPGDNLTLTIDSRLQALAQEALGSQRGSIVVIDPNNGEVLAMVSTPSYNPNDFVAGLTQKQYDTLMHEPAQPLFNRSIRGQYPLASTIKPFIALQGLLTKTVTPKTSIDDPGWFQLKTSNHHYRDWRPYGHGEVNVNKAIRVSCDTYFYQLANKLGIESLAKMIKQFGFGKRTHIDMPGELGGLVPTPAWKKRVHGAPWYPGDTLVAGIGQGYMLTTPLQLANGTAKLAERGRAFQPHLVLTAKQADGTITPSDPAPQTSVSAPRWIWDTVINAMQSVISAPDGTGYHFGRDALYTVAGKTGTGQVYSSQKYDRYSDKTLPYKLRNHTLFIGFAPIEHPLIALSIVVEHSDSHVESSPSASHIARLLMDEYLLKEKHWIH